LECAYIRRSALFSDCAPLSALCRSACLSRTWLSEGQTRRLYIAGQCASRTLRITFAPRLAPNEPAGHRPVLAGLESCCVLDKHIRTRVSHTNLADFLHTHLQCTVHLQEDVSDPVQPTHATPRTGDTPRGISDGEKSHDQCLHKTSVIPACVRVCDSNKARNIHANG
jgi:hypothetical protein